MSSTGCNGLSTLSPLDVYCTDRVFTILANLRTISEPLRTIPQALTVTSQVMVSHQRINTYLLDDKLKSDEIAASKWEVQTACIDTEGHHLKVEKGEKLAVCGSVGAGKYSLIQFSKKFRKYQEMLVGVIGSIAQVSQIAWIQSGAIRENILYGKPTMDEERYNKAMTATALDKDIRLSAIVI
ncbi:hypothetical protein Cgig2_007170 [Carnegiea gigantea]|uniref:ABC transporter domain-containing protein n=1 Tax=Carnegiea gigantea TaxID=171969 RepID=A0A9Q1JS45_9CARY|nr:hypothetical protein Cgig2_007170 [Carnegiea gigantea]